jgi:hypothetical protein
MTQRNLRWHVRQRHKQIAVIETITINLRRQNVVHDFKTFSWFYNLKEPSRQVSNYK